MTRRRLYRSQVLETKITVRIPAYDVRDARRLGINMSDVARSAIHFEIVKRKAYVARRGRS